MSRFALALAVNEKKADDPKPRGQLYPRWKELGLSKDQVAAIYKIQSEHRSLFPPLPPSWDNPSD